jgi:dTDP-4-amino-4,6-dideoxygalactose transaminase
MDPDDLQSKATPTSRVVIPVHPFGLSADMDRINEVARALAITVVEDAACALGSTYRDRACGSLGLAGCFSFHPRKAITTGEGGMVTTDDLALADRMRVLRSHGGVRSEGRFTFDDAGFNYRLSDILAAIGVSQMGKLDTVIREKRRLAQVMDELLAGAKGITVPTVPIGLGHVFQSYVVMLDDDIDRDAVIAFMRDKDIETTIGTYALHREPFFKREFGYRPGDLPVSDRSFRQSLTLPLYPGLRGPQMERVAFSLREAIVSARRRAPVV